MNGCHSAVFHWPQMHQRLKLELAGRSAEVREEHAGIHCLPALGLETRQEQADKLETLAFM